MYKHILVPVDGSVLSESAITTAAELARRANARLHIVQVCGALDADDNSRFGARTYLDGIAARYSAKYGVGAAAAVLYDPVTGVDYAIPPSAIVTKVLREYIRANGIDMIVLTTHGLGGFVRAWLGSVADELVRTASTSVLAIKPIGIVVRSRPPILAQRILIALDMSDRDQELIARTLEFGEPYNAEYTLMHVTQPALVAMAAAGVESYAEMAPDIDDCARAYVERLAATVAATGSSADVEVTSMPFIASEIIAYAEAHHFDVVSVATRGRSPLGRAIWGSVADKIIRGAPMPVLVHRILEGADTRAVVE